MYFKNIYFHNVKSMQKDENGNYLISRFDESLLNDADANFNDGKLSTGAELRFKVVSDTVKIKLKLQNGQSPAVCEVYFGNYFAGNDYVVEITENGVEYTFDKSKIPTEVLKNNKGFYPNVVRILLPSKNVLFVSVEGETEYPQKYEMPNKTIAYVGSTPLAYGDLDKPSFSVPFQLSSNLNVDYLNLCYFDNEELFNKLLPFLTSLNKETIFVVELVTQDIDDKNVKKQLKYSARKVKLLGKLKGRVLFVNSFINHLKLTKERGNRKVNAKINKMLKKQVSEELASLYLNHIINGVNSLPLYALNACVMRLLLTVKGNFKNFNKEVKVSLTPIRYFKATDGDEPLLTAPIMTKRDIQEQNKLEKAKLLEKKEQEKLELQKQKEDAKIKKEQEKQLKAQKKAEQNNAEPNDDLNNSDKTDNN